MTVTVPTGRTAHELVELHPEVLECGHRWQWGGVLIGMGAHPDGGRRRTWTCKEDYVVTWDAD